MFFLGRARVPECDANFFKLQLLRFQNSKFFLPSFFFLHVLFKHLSQER